MRLQWWDPNDAKQSSSAARKVINLPMFTPRGFVGRSREMLQLVHVFKCELLNTLEARLSLIPSLCTYFTRAGIEWRR